MSDEPPTIIAPGKNARVLLSGGSERRGAAVLHRRRSRLHQLAHRWEVESHGYCLECINSLTKAIRAVFEEAR